jgi:hypothetical protein
MKSENVSFTTGFWEMEEIILAAYICRVQISAMAL